MPKPEAIHLVFQIERDTKNKVRFQEMTQTDGSKAPQPVAKDKAVVEKLYIAKSVLKKNGDPETAHVTIEFP